MHSCISFIRALTQNMCQQIFAKLRNSVILFYINRLNIFILAKMIPTTSTKYNDMLSSLQGDLPELIESLNSSIMRVSTRAIF